MEAKSKNFSKKEALTFGWETFKKNYRFIVPFFIAAFVIQMVPGMVASSFQKSAPLLGGLIQIVGWVVNLVISMGLLRVALKFYDKQRAEFSDLWSSYPLVFKYFLGNLLYLVIVVVGFVLLIIPGIIFALKFMFYSYLIIDKKRGPVEAIKESAVLTQGSKLNLFLFGILIALVNIGGFLALGVGLLVSVPVTSIAMAYAFRKLSSS